LNGFTNEGLVQKLAPSISKNGFLYLSGKGKSTKKTNNPEKSNLSVFLVEGFDKIG
jgi:hypothetical protein